MSINNNPSRENLVGNGAQQVFNYNFEIFVDEDLKVYISNVLQNSGYTVAGAGEDDGGTITFSSAPANDAPIKLVREIVLERTVDYPQAGDLLSTALNTDFDRIWAALQEIKTEVSDRTIKLQQSDDDATLQLELAADRAGTVLGFDANGNLDYFDISVPGFSELAGNENGYLRVDPTGTGYVYEQGTTVRTNISAQPLDADLTAVAALATTGLATRTASDTWTTRSIAGTANEITITNGDGVSGNPTASLPTALTFTGKTITGGTFTGVDVRHSITTGITAAGTDQAGATALTSSINVVTTVAVSNDGVRLPTAAAGMEIKVINDDTVDTLKIYPATGAAIDAGSANASINLGPGAKLTLIASSTTQWYAFYGVYG